MELQLGFTTIEATYIKDTQNKKNPIILYMNIKRPKMNLSRSNLKEEKKNIMEITNHIQVRKITQMTQQIFKILRKF